MSFGSFLRRGPGQGSQMSTEQAIRTNCAEKLTTIASEHGKVLEGLRTAIDHSSLMLEEAVETVKARLLKQDSQDQRNHPITMEVIQQLMEEFRKLLDAMHLVNERKKLIETIKANMASGCRADGGELSEMRQQADDDETADNEENVDNPAEYFKREATRLQEEYAGLSEYKKYHDVEEYVELAKKIWDLEHDSSEPFALVGAEGEGDNSDAELAVISEQFSTKCPITMAVMTDPYTSKVCKHSFSEAIITLINRTGDGRCECPMAGCRKYIRVSDLYKNKRLQRRIQRVLEEAEGEDF